MKNDNVTTVVFHNGYTIQFKLRDEDHRRFKVFPSYVMERFGEEYPTVHYDDCSGEDLALIIRFVMGM